jgi:hypothetical protein
MLVRASSATTMTAGQLYQDAAIIPNHQTLVLVSFTAYSSSTGLPASVVATLGATLCTANQYQGGYAFVTEGTGIGQTLRIASNTAATTGSDTTIVFEDSPNVALVAGNSKISLFPAHGLDVIVSPTTQTNVVAGIGLYPIAASSYGFVHTKGLVSSLSDSVVATVGQAISPSVTTAGTTTLAKGTNSTCSAIIGNAAQLAVSTKAYAVFLNV